MTKSPVVPGIDVPLVDLAAQHAEVADEVAEGFARVLANTSYVGGPDVALFEQALAEWWGRLHVIGLGNGTDALELMIRAAGIGPGDEVILPANSFVATLTAVLRAGAKPVLVDVDPTYLLIDPQGVADRITPRTRAVIPVHLFGQISPMEDLASVVADRPIVLLEDAAQAHGARRFGAAAGTVGIAAATSFYPGKNLGAYGDGGAVLTDRAEMARRVRLLGNHGATSKYDHNELGFNSRLDTLQAVVLSAKLKRLTDWNQARVHAAERYREILSDHSAVWLPETMPGNDHVWHLFSIRLEHRDDVLKGLQTAGIGAGVHYPIPLHLQGVASMLGHSRGHFPNAEAAAQRLLSLPLHPHLTVNQQDYIAAKLEDLLP
ncbi:MAG: DegT/DnrJ/EryC1/StrS family aminotransferase [Actinomycetes bacterium]